MADRLIRVTLLLAVLAGAWSLAAGDAAAIEPRQRVAPDLFYNYYVAPGPYGGPGAELYVSPLPTPPYVGHTWITYQPLMPHEFLYPHCRKYCRQHPDGRWTRTCVIWQ
jgi:hypothetical protein